MDQLTKLKKLQAFLAHQELAKFNENLDLTDALNRIQMMKGETGEQGPPGEDGEDGERGERGVPGIRGEQGIPGQDGRDGTDGADGAPGADGLSPSPEVVVPLVLEQIRMPAQQEVILDGPEEIRDKLQELTKDDRLDSSAIKGLDEKYPNNKKFNDIIERLWQRTRFLINQSSSGGASGGSAGSATVAGTNAFVGLNEFSGQTNISGPNATTNVEIGSVANDANAGTGGNGVAIGNGSSIGGGGIQNTVIGSLATSASGNGVAIGHLAVSSGNGSIAIGKSASTSVGAAIAIGLSAIAGTNQVVIGSSVGVAKNVWIGPNVTTSASAATTPVTFNGLGGVGTDIGGGNLSLASGAGTGAGAVSSLIFLTPTVLTTGTTVQTQTSRGIFSSSGLQTSGTANSTVLVGSISSAAIATGTDTVAIGRGANAGVQSNTVVIGAGAQSATNTPNVVIGAGAQGNAGSNIVIGQGAISGNNVGIAIGTTATTTGNPAIAIGHAASASTNQVVIGSSVGAAKNVFIGPSLATSASAATTPITINGVGGLGTDIVGGALLFAPGRSTGAAVPANVIIQATTAIGTSTTQQTLINVLTVGAGGSIGLLRTITAVGTTGNQTINQPAGTVNIAAAGTTVTVTNNLVTASSIIFAEIRTNDATARIANVVPGAGSFVINIVACTNEVSIGFFVTN